MKANNLAEAVVVDLEPREKHAILTLKTAELTELISGSEKVLLDFWAPWCRPCRALEPLLLKLHHRYGSALTIVKVNIDQQGEIARQFNVRSIPTLLLVQENAVTLRISPAETPEAYIVAQLDQYLPREEKCDVYHLEPKQAAT